MPTRDLVDTRGRRWHVWEVQPTLAERRRGLPDWRPQPRAERRRGEVELRVAIHERYATGWLVFERPGERRRLAPVPEGWEQSTDTELEALCMRAVATRPPRRLIE